MVVTKTAQQFSLGCCQVLAFTSCGQQAAGHIEPVWPEEDQAFFGAGISPLPG